MPLALQAKLLRVIQERKVRPVGDNVARDIDVRLLAATHKDLKTAIKHGTFREDLFFRLNVVPIQLPALRERTEDIPVLAQHFLEKFCERGGVPVKSLTKAAMAKLLRLGWAGNVRELENTIERAVVLSCSELIDEHEIRAEGSSDHELAVRELFAAPHARAARTRVHRVRARRDRRSQGEGLRDPRHQPQDAVSKRARLRHQRGDRQGYGLAGRKAI